MPYHHYLWLLRSASLVEKSRRIFIVRGPFYRPGVTVVATLDIRGLIVFDVESSYLIGRG